MWGVLGVVAGIILILVGGFLIIFFPGTEEHQPLGFSILGIVMGFAFVIIGCLLIFL